MFGAQLPRRAARLIAALAALLAALAVAVVPQQRAAQADASGRGGDFVPFAAPREVLDTQQGVAPRSETPFQVLGVGGVPTAGVSGVLVRVVAIADASHATWLTLYPHGTPRPGVAMVNVPAGMALSNTAIVRPGASGRMVVYNAAGSTRVIVEAQGYFTTATGSTWGGFVPVTQRRVVDTRSGLGIAKGPIGANIARTVDLSPGGIPDGASAAFVSLTVPSAPETTWRGWFGVIPHGSTRPTNGIINYEDRIHHASGASVPLTQAGQATFMNMGPTPAHLVVDVLGYFTRTPTSGAGFRPATDRLYGAIIPAHGAVDVVVGGTNGMPTRGVAAVALSLQSGGRDFGALRAGPTGAPGPGPSLTQHPANGVGRSSAIVKPGIDGKVRIENLSDTQSEVYVDLQGWFADPLPSVPIAQNAPVGALQPVPPPGQPLSRIEYAYTNNLGEVWIGHQTDPDNFGSIQWRSISGLEAFSGRPSLRRLPDGRVAMAVQYSDSDVWATSQTAVGAATWHGWTDLGGSLAAPPATALLSNGTSVLFGVDVDGRLWANAQTGEVPFWRNLGDRNLTGTPTVVPVRDGLQLFARTSTGAIATLLYRADGTVSATTGLGGTGTGAPAVVVYPGPRLRVFMRAADDTIMTKVQDATGAFPAAWDRVGSLLAGGDPAAILDSARGLTAVLVRGKDNMIQLSMETAQGSGVFGDWRCATNGCEISTADPVVAPITNSNGPSWIFTGRTSNGNAQIFIQPQSFAGPTFAATTEAARK